MKNNKIKTQSKPRGKGTGRTTAMAIKSSRVHCTVDGNMAVDTVRFTSLVTDRLSDTVLLVTTLRRIMGIADSVYSTGLTAAFNGNTNTATHANTCGHGVGYHLKFPNRSGIRRQNL